jgi:uncharacterized protein YciI
MKRHAVMVALFLLASAALVQPQEPQHKLVQFQMAIFKKGPKWDRTPELDRGISFGQHFAYVSTLIKSNVAVIGGSFDDSAPPEGVLILRTTAEEAKKVIERDPAVKDRMVTAEVHPRWSEDIFKNARSLDSLERLYFGFLKKGPNRKEGDDKNAEIQELQKAHIANIVRLAEMKKMVMAGPFGDEGELRGIFVFRVASMKEAQELAATDPMIKIDRLRIDLHSWHVPVGVIP